MNNKKLINKIEVEIFKRKNSVLFNVLDDVKNSKKGKNETYFLKHLRFFFGNKIFIDKNPYIGIKIYEPDYVLYEEELNLYFDIEIDEPYSFKDGITIHHDRTNDSKRNIFFNDINWVVIRFSEKQAVENPIECCELIYAIIDSIKKREKLVNNNVPIENFWSHEEALVMRQNNYRNSYKRYD